MNIKIRCFKIGLAALLLINVFFLSSCNAPAFNLGNGELIDNPDDIPDVTGYTFGGWYYDNGTFELPYSEDDDIKKGTTVYA